MSDPVENLIDRAGVLLDWCHTQSRDGAVLVPLAAVVDIMAGLSPSGVASWTREQVARVDAQREELEDLRMQAAKDTAELAQLYPIADAAAVHSHFNTIDTALALRAAVDGYQPGTGA